MIARRGYRAPRPAAWLAMLAILLQALLPAVLPGGNMAMAASGSDTIARLDIAQNLCRAPGDTTPIDRGHTPLDHQLCCALCLTVHAVSSFAPPSAPAIAVNRAYGFVVPVEAAFVLPPLRPSLRQQQPRPPPVFI
jgi:hypothetical protein